MMKLLTAIAITSSILLGCKPTVVGSRALESGGDPVTWRVTPTLTSQATSGQTRGELRVEKTGTGATELPTKISRVELQVQTAPEGSLPKERLSAQQWIAMSQGTDDLSFNLLMTTESAGTCYANGTRLNGTSEAVFCKGAGTVTVASAADIARELKTACLRLVTLKVDPDKLDSTEVFARSDTLTADTACVCLNGKERTLRFDEFNNKPLKDAAAAFESACRRREAKLNETLTAVDKNYNACVELAAIALTKLGRTDIQAGLKACTCGTQKLNYDEPRFATDAQALDKECRTITSIAATLTSAATTPPGGGVTLPPAADGSVTTSEADKARLQEMRKYCKDRAHHDLTTHCDCRDDGITVDKTDVYSTYKSLDDFKRRVDSLLCD